MQTYLNIQEDEYTLGFCVLLYADARFADEENPWLFLHKYPDLLRAENGMRRQKEINGDVYVYKIMQFNISAETRQRG